MHEACIWLELVTSANSSVYFYLIFFGFLILYEKAGGNSVTVTRNNME